MHLIASTIGVKTRRNRVGERVSPWNMPLSILRVGVAHCLVVIVVDNLV